MSKTSVVNVMQPEQGKHTVYIGRGGPGGASEQKYGTDKPMGWGNPYPVGEGEGKYTREEAIARFEQDVLADPAMLERIATELPGEVLGCFCHPQACHGDVLAKYATMSVEQPLAYQVLIDRARSGKSSMEEKPASERPPTSDRPRETGGR